MTFLLADIEGSTALVRRSGDGFRQALAAFRAVMTEQIRAGGGTVVDVEGDSVLAAFSSAAGAAGSAHQVHRALDHHPFPAAMAVRARIGIHTGPAWPRDGTYVALALNQAVRVAATAHGGQTVVSAVTRAELEGAVPALVDLGHYWLRDFEEPVTLYQVSCPALPPPTFPALRVAVPAQGHGLDLDVTSFRGREQEIDELLDLLRHQRLTTVVGPGGAGKSRLAREVTRRLPAARHDLRLIELGPLREPAAVPGAVAAAVGLKLDDDRPQRDMLVEHLRHVEVILVLDNCEHLHQPVAQLVRSMVGACPGVRVLATSRRPLQIPGENALRLPPLGPEAASQLFLDRAGQHGWRPDAADEALIPELCRHLDGLPLALEMAAGWTTILTVNELATALTRAPTDLAAAEGAGGDERHRSLATVIDWSYQLLDRDEQEALARLSVLRDRFDLATAAAVLGDLAPTGPQVAALVRGLVDRSVVMAGRHGERSVYHLHATVRSFANQQLAASGHQGAVLLRLGRWFRDQLEDRVNDRVWATEVANQLGNLSGVIEGLLDDDPRLAARLGQVVARHAWSTGDFGSTIEQLATWASALVEPSVEAQGLVGHVTFNLVALRREVEGAAWARRHAELTAAVGTTDPTRPQEALQAYLALDRDPAAALALCRELMARDDAERVLNDHGRLQAHWVAQIALLLLGDLEEERAELDRCLELAYRMNDHTAIVLLSANHLHHEAARHGLASQARNLLHWSLHQYPMTSASFCITVVDPAAWLAFDLGRHHDAARLLHSMLSATTPTMYYEEGRAPADLVSRLETATPEVWAAARAAPPLDLDEALDLARDVLADPRLEPGDGEPITGAGEPTS